MTSSTTYAFIGGGNMATALIGGLMRQGVGVDHIQVVEPADSARAALLAQWGLRAAPAATPALGSAEQVIWAVKPQTFHEASATVAQHTGHALHISVAAGIPTTAMARWLNVSRIVRAMPNTPALIGCGVTGLFASAQASAADRIAAEALFKSTGDYLWVDSEDQLDVVTALSGSGPAYVFYFLEAMVTAGTEMGLSHEQAYRLALGTFTGATNLAHSSTETPQQLRQKVTSKGGTTHAAITSMDCDDVRAAFVNAMYAARERATQLGQEFGSA